MGNRRAKPVDVENRRQLPAKGLKPASNDPAFRTGRFQSGKAEVGVLVGRARQQ